ncbi:MAG: hypothetical protein WD850_02205 [Candidatus Spechtbacterales bacterium]
MPRIPENQLKNVQRLYYKDRVSMREIAEALDVSLDAVVYFMRRHGLARRSFSEINADRFARKAPSFKERTPPSSSLREMRAVVAMLYWGEGYKSDKSAGLDFANSDQAMVVAFLKALRGIYELDESRFRVLLYCYADQDSERLIVHWSRVTGIARQQFTKPYVRRDFRPHGRKMPYGMVHIRYADKKLLMAVKKLIEYYVAKYGQVVP